MGLQQQDGELSEFTKASGWSDGGSNLDRPSLRSDGAEVERGGDPKQGPNKSWERHGQDPLSLQGTALKAEA